MLKLGYVHVKLEHYEDAIDDFTRLLRWNKNIRDAYYYRAYARLSLLPEKSKDTCRDLSKAAEMGHVQAAHLLQKYCH